jgi:hypothetical protein
MRSLHLTERAKSKPNLSKKVYSGTDKEKGALSEKEEEGK